MGQKFKYKFNWTNHCYLNNNKLCSLSFLSVISNYINIKVFRDLNVKNFLNFERFQSYMSATFLIFDYDLSWC